jgi:phosphate-selective porin
MNKIILIGLILFCGNILFAQKDTLSNSIIIRKGNKGIEFQSRDNKYLLQLEVRGQLRFSYPYDQDPVTLNDFDPANDKGSLKVNRARLKIGGHSFQPWLKYYFEYELAASKLLDFRVMFEKYPFLKIKVGQWKAQYNRERIISSGKQQTAERSILTRSFTIDRQQGISLFGRLKNGGLADFNYWASLFMGTGRGAENNDDKNPMYMFRLQWNLNEKPLKFSGSDLKYHEKFTPIIAIAAVTNISPYTRFSTAGGGQLEGFDEGLASQNKVDQLLFETAFKLKGISWQQEIHWKKIDDRINKEITILAGGLFQIGYFFHHSFSFVPPQLELYARYAIYDPNLRVETDYREEFTTGANWFFNGHKNKLTAEYTYSTFREGPDLADGGSRVRFQWDISF